MNRSFTFAGALLGLSAALCAGACVQSRETQTVTRAVELGDAEAVDVELRMGAGELHVEGGSPKLLDATFRSNLPTEPLLDYQDGGARASLRLQQPPSALSFGRYENRWDLRFNDRVPIDLTIGLGAAAATMNLGTLNLEGLTIEMGAGELNLDLRGTPRQSYDVRVSGGVGSAHIRLPRSVAIVATATAGIGNIEVQGLEKGDDAWYNPGHEDDPIAIHLDVRGGLGEIVVSAEEP